MRGIDPYNVVGYSIYHMFTQFQIHGLQVRDPTIRHGKGRWVRGSMSGSILHSSFFSNNQRCTVNKVSFFVIHHPTFFLKRRVFKIKPIFTIDDVVMCDVFLTLQVALHQRFHTVKVEQLTTFSSGAPHTFLKIWNQKLFFVAHQCGLSTIMPLGKLPPEAVKTI